MPTWAWVLTAFGAVILVAVLAFAFYVLRIVNAIRHESSPRNERWTAAMDRHAKIMKQWENR